MIQRIQTLFILTAVILVSLLGFLPLAELASKDGQFFKATLLGIQSLGQTVTGSVYTYLFPAGVLVLVLAALFRTIFLYKNRVKQIKFAWISIRLLVIQVFANVWPVYRWGADNGATVSYKVSMALPLVAVVLVLLAIRNIRKDEELVKSVDRIR